MSSVDGLSGEQRRYMIMERAKAACDDGASRSTNARDAMEACNPGSILGALGGLLQGVFCKGGGKGGGGGGGKGG